MKTKVVISASLFVLVVVAGTVYLLSSSSENAEQLSARVEHERTETEFVPRRSNKELSDGIAEKNKDREKLIAEERANGETDAKALEHAQKELGMLNRTPEQARGHATKQLERINKKLEAAVDP